MQADTGNTRMQTKQLAHLPPILLSPTILFLHRFPHKGFQFTCTIPQTMSDHGDWRLDDIIEPQGERLPMFSGLDGRGCWQRLLPSLARVTRLVILRTWLGMC